jgi:hypothetical protein
VVSVIVSDGRDLERGRLLRFLHGSLDAQLGIPQLRLFWVLFSEQRRVGVTYGVQKLGSWGG